MEPSFAQESGWVAEALIASRLEQRALLQLLLKKRVLQPEEYLDALGELVADDYQFSVRRFVAESETVLRNGRWHIGGASATEHLGRRLALERGDRVLDIGCGIGGPARQIAETFGCVVVGVDHRIERIIEAVLRTSALGLTRSVSFQVGEAGHLPFESDSFDAVISQATFHWLPDKDGCIREVYRVLKPSGRFGFECEAATEKAAWNGGYPQPEEGLFRILAWQQLLGASGFTDIEIEEMWEESRAFYPTGPEREQIDRGERVNIRIVCRKL
ncbi:MAG: methyltransferase domain-containing protein [Candidatus Sumerlaeia bacterium]|nr:methyltransferase domain-containing protein [Candidatus Sumerlaeia bacterium]